MAKELLTCKSRRNYARWQYAKKTGAGIQLQIDIYVPVPPLGTTERYNQEKLRRMEVVRAKLKELKETVEALEGLVKVCLDV